MGWFGFGPFDGDDAMDCEFDVANIASIDDTYFWDLNHYDFNRNKLMDARPKIIEWLRDYDWSSRSNPGFIQEAYIQCVAALFVEFDVPVTEKEKETFISFIDNDQWSKKELERAVEMQTLKEKVEKLQVIA